MAVHIASRDESKPLASFSLLLLPFSVLLSSTMLCEAPFYPNQFNYVNDDEHDKNSRKHWYLVLGVGLFTAKYAQHLFFFAPSSAHARLAELMLI